MAEVSNARNQFMNWIQVVFILKKKIIPYILPAVPRNWFESAVCGTICIQYLSILCTPKFDPNSFRGTYCILIFIINFIINFTSNFDKSVFCVSSRDWISAEYKKSLSCALARLVEASNAPKLCYFRYPNVQLDFFFCYPNFQ